MKIGIMQPYFFPYIGYWQLINSVDKFVIYDNIKFEKKGWMRRNRFLCNGKEHVFSIPIRHDSDYLDVRDRVLCKTAHEEKSKMINRIKTSYKNAPQFQEVFPIIEECINFKSDNLFEYVFNTITKVVEYLDIGTEIIVSSSVDMDHTLRGKHRVVETCRRLGGEVYINPIGGIELYDKDEFLKSGIELMFIKTGAIRYSQFDNPFVPNLSVVDVMMFNSKERVVEILDDYILL